ncbi:MAG: RagB/SusD family nutrient uptake outer membrane protein, partial [Bacteroidales bacterium]|nr:RagB/SusD family nutrient uptake outer membrane protein [Bacteroidales bacterium]
MKKIFAFIITAIAAALMTVSCNLELEPTGAIVIKEGNPVIYTHQDLEEFEARIMAYFRSLHGGSLNCIEDVMLDEFNATAGFGNNYGGVHRTDASYTSSDNYIESYWSSHYYAIKDYNFLIDALDQEINVPEGSEQAAKLIQGEAYMFRADAYLNMVRHFGKDYDPADDKSLGVPLVLHYDLYARPARNTVHEVYAQVKEDLDS